MLFHSLLSNQLGRLFGSAGEPFLGQMQMLFVGFVEKFVHPFADDRCDEYIRRPLVSFFESHVQKVDRGFFVPESFAFVSWSYSGVQWNESMTLKIQRCRLQK